MLTRLYIPLHMRSDSWLETVGSCLEKDIEGDVISRVRLPVKSQIGIYFYQSANNRFEVGRSF